MQTVQHYDPWASLKGYVVAAQEGPLTTESVELDETGLGSSPGRCLVAASTPAMQGSPILLACPTQQTQFTANIFWVPWNRNGNMGYSYGSVDAAGYGECDIMLTSFLSGCHIVGSRYGFVHLNAAYIERESDLFGKRGVGLVAEQLAEDDKPADSLCFLLSPQDKSQGLGEKEIRMAYGEAGQAPRAFMMGVRHGDEWVFAYQDLTHDSSNYGTWRGLIPTFPLQQSGCNSH